MRAGLALLLLLASAAEACDPDRLREALLAYMSRGVVRLDRGQYVSSSAGKNRSGAVEHELGSASFITDQGPRTLKVSNNQDGVLSGTTPDGRVVHLIADGISTGGGGDVASSTLVATAKTTVHSGQSLRQAFDRFIPALQRAAGDDPRLAKMGATVLGLEINESGVAVVTHAGDVRLVQMRGDRVVHETKDHNRAQEDVDAGKLTPEQRLKSPLNRVVTKNYVIGDGFEQVGVRPTSRELDIEAGDLVILASDGLFGVMTSRQVRQVVTSMHSEGRKPSTAEIATRLRQEAHARTLQGFEPDNITILVYRHTAEGH